MKTTYYSRIIGKTALLTALYLTTQNLSAQHTPVAESQIDQLIHQKTALEKEGKFKNIFTIQLYYGDREKAYEMKMQYDQKFSTWESKLQWETPFHKVWVGTFKTRIAADRALIKIKEEFNDAFVLQPQNN